ncbi:MAG: trypsin-like peptidase domain-containing protein [Bacteroidota bacterium]|nr:trypsin-like peptidase domain-containing protein [Bacteroidota bacterium]MDP4211446.1 trypsin-like peptidase domain-containing protein [Bacteroidota bacterium]MDP4249795.1 trypsin-like peptidase domain-containing protein [Bacteroidota bacterium]
MKTRLPFLRSFFAWALLGSSIFTPTQAQKYTAVQNYGINRPGVVMIRTVFSADVYVNNMRLDSRNFNHLLDSLQKIDSSGAIFTPEQKLDIVLTEISNNPNRFFKASLDYIKQPEEITSSGTGFLITGDGYVATNCHLIDRDKAFIRRQFILSAFQQITEANISAFENAWATRFSEQQRTLLYNTYASVYARLFSMALYDLKKDIFVEYSADSTNGSAATVKKIAHIVIRGQPMPGKDIAILKIDGDSSLPTLKIAVDDLPRVGEQLFVYGFPGPVTNNNYVATESAIEPTLTTGIVSALKKSVEGWPLIQMDANINRGSSGGPVCNEKGEVVGLTTFGSIENSGGLAAGLNFAIPVSILEEYLDSAEVVARLSDISIVFADGVLLYDQEYYRDALRKFQQVKKINNKFPGLTSYINDSEKRLHQNNERKASMIRNDLLILGLLLFIALVLFRFLKKRRLA